MSSANMVSAERFGVRVHARAQAMVENRREIFERFTILLALNIILGGSYSPGTPKDTGFAQNSWVVAINGTPAFRQAGTPGASFSFDARAGRTRNVTTGRFAKASQAGGAVNVISFTEAVARLRGVQLGATVVFASNCVYIRRLEFGHSQQAPSGFYRLSAAAAPQMARDAASQVRATKDVARQLRLLRAS